MSSRASPSSDASGSTTPNAPNTSSQPSTSASNGGKVKQTRRRQRLSCVECTKRRQKCDRQFPCGLCTSRGIPHLCRWEPIVVRPTPQRPPVAAIQAATDANATIEALMARVAALEQALNNKENGDLSNRPGSDILGNTTLASQSNLIPSSRSSSVDTDEDHPSGDQAGPRALLDYNVQVAAVALAQLSLAPRTEYIGSGTVLCALHKLGEPELWRYPYPQSALMMTNQMPAISKPGSPHPVISPIRRLISQLPSRAHVDDLLDSFFAARNAEIGLSELWFRSACQQMWYHLDLRCSPECLSQGGCQACSEEINPHWLSLLFALLALSPGGGPNAIHYANNSLAARRIVDDILLSSPAYSASEGSVHGGVLSCLAAALLSAYLADRGRVSEAWKLCGSALRNAQALGLHRDPRWRKWEAMGPVEIDLRMGTWWILAVADRLYSYILGRPPMTIKGTFETMPWPPNTFGDGSSNRHALFQRQFILLTDLICEASISCLGLNDPTFATVVEMDRKFQDWEAQLPPMLRWRANSRASSPQSSESHFDGIGGNGESTSFCPRSIASQRVTLAIWYLDTLMGIHRPYLMHPPSKSSSRPGSPEWKRVNPSRERCIELAIELTSILCQYHRQILAKPPSERVLPNMFSYFLFDGAVALAGALSQVPPHTRATECLDLIDNAMSCLRNIAETSKDAVDGEGETASRALKVLAALRRAGGWDLDEGEKGELVSLMNYQERRTAVLGNGQSPGSSLNTMEYQARSPHHEAEMNFFRHHTSASFPSNIGNIPEQSSSSSYWMTPSVMASPSYFGENSSNHIPNSLSPASTDFIPFQSGTVEFAVNSGKSQGPLNPYNILQGVQQSSNQDISDFDMDWARLAGMENWYSGGMSHGVS